MAFIDNDLKDVFEAQQQINVGAGTPTTLTIAADAFSITADIDAFTNTQDSPTIVMTLKLQFAVQPTAGTNINIYARKMDIEGTNDSSVPDDNNIDQIIGRFTVDATVATSTDAFLTTQWMTISNHYSAQVYQFYLQNKSDQSISAGWELFLTQVSKGPFV